MSEVEQEAGNGADRPILFLRSTPAIQKFLRRLRDLTDKGVISADSAREVLKHEGAATVPYTALRDVWLLYPKHLGRFHNLVAGSTLELESPAPRVKSKELVERLAKLQDVADRREYDALVSDGKPAPPEYFSSYKEQLGFGLHVAVTMLVCCLVGYYMCRAMFQSNPALHSAGAAAGIIFGMLLETTLYIIRISQYEEHLQKKNS